MIIRELRAHELHQLNDLYTHYLNRDQIPPLTKEKINEIWTHINANPCIHYFVGEVDQTIVASCILTITPSFIRGGDGFGIIEHVVTHTQYRQNGYGTAMMKFSLAFAWEQGCTEVMLLSGSQNIRAHRLYEHLGFDKHRKTGFIIFKPDGRKNRIGSC